ncbi:MAG: flavodoxin domain-containing protein [Rhizobiaceae bacterium]
MNLLIAYATTEGQTEKIARRIGSDLSGAGHEVHFCNVSEVAGGASPSDVDRVIVAGSVHSANHQKDLEMYVFANRDQLNAMPTLFLSVSLAAAFVDNREDAERYVDTFKEKTGWEPTAHSLVAGAVKPDYYDWFEESALMEGDLASHISTDLTQEYEFTDWEALNRSVSDFVGR